MATTPSLRTATIWIATGSILKILIRLLQIHYLANLLAPSDFGIASTASLVIGTAGLIADLGVNAATIQKKDIKVDERDTLFWLNLLLSIALAITVLCSADTISSLLNQPNLSPAIQVFSLSMPLTAASAQIRANSEKKLKFRGLVVSEVFSSTVTLTSTVWAAAWLKDPLAIAFGWTTNAFSMAALSWLFLSDGWRPRIPNRLPNITRSLYFGVGLTANNLVNQIGTSADIILAARFFDAGTLGIYTVPRELISNTQAVINPVFTRTGFPLLASAQDDRKRTTTLYRQLSILTALANSLCYTTIFLFSEAIIINLLGAEWKESVTVLRLMSLWAFFRALGGPATSLLLGLGRSHYAFYWNLILAILTPIAAYGGVSNGPSGIAAYLTAWTALMTMVMWNFLVRPYTDTTFLAHVTSLGAPAFLLFGPAAMIVWILPNEHSVYSFAIRGFFVTFTSLLAAILLFPSQALNVLRRSGILGHVLK